MKETYSFNCEISELNDRIQAWLYSDELKNIVHAFGSFYPDVKSVDSLAKWLLNFSEKWDYRNQQKYKTY